ncbi:MAG: TPM domain-containing protein [Burkholderiaceae bacterium]|nr:TPM domain-containing protein [Burkholderiaceae bacterium]
MHLLHQGWPLRRAFPAPTLDAIEEAISAGEQRHGAELRFVVEARLGALAVWAGVTPRARAAALFSDLRVWDTEANNGVLVYVLLADRAVEIVADRGARARVQAEVWNKACATMTTAFGAGDFQGGTVRALASLAQALATAFPPDADNPDELPNRPTVL